MKSKKAEMSIAILVIGVFVVCGFALLSFFISNVNVRDSFVGVGLIEKINSQFEIFLVHRNLNEVDVRVNLDGKTGLYQEKIDYPGILFWKKERLIFSVEYGLPS